MKKIQLENYDLAKFQNGLDELEIRLSEKQLEQLMLYYELLVEKNKVMNLTAITEFQDVMSKHFLDSLSLVIALDPADLETVIDVGTGAGFPGIPLKIAFPDLRVTLVDSLKKRVDFLNEVILKLGLKGIWAVHGRAEDLGKDKKYRENYDLCVSRAVAALPLLCEYCIPFVGEGGLFVAYKGKDGEGECRKASRAVELLGGVIADLVLYSLPESGEERSLIVIEKEQPTPKTYPRKAGIPEKRPL